MKEKNKEISLKGRENWKRKIKKPRRPGIRSKLPLAEQLWWVDQELNQDTTLSRIKISERNYNKNNKQIFIKKINKQKIKLYSPRYHTIGLKLLFIFMVLASLFFFMNHDSYSFGSLVISDTTPVENQGFFSFGNVFTRISNFLTGAAVSTDIKEIPKTVETAGIPTSSSGLSIQAECGGITPCSCGDSVTASLTLTENLSGPGPCLTTNADNIIIDCNGYTLRRNGDTYPGIYINSTNVTVKNCLITNFSYGILFESGFSNSTAVNNTIYDNTYGIGLSGFANTLDSNSIYNNSYYGVSMGITKDHNVRNNIIYDNGYYGFSLVDVNTSTFTNNTVNTSSVTGYGFFLFGAISNNFTDNIVTTINSNASGFHVVPHLGFFNSSSNVFKDNTIKTIGVNAHGFFLNNSGSNNITGNTINTSGNGGRGIYLISASDNILISNIIDTNNTNSHGIYSYSSNSIDIINNEITADNAYGILINNSVSNTIFSNNVTTYNNGEACIYVISDSMNTSANITSNILNTTLGGGIYVRNSTENTLMSNIVDIINGDVGVYLYNASSNIINDNNITVNGSESMGIFLAVYSSSNSFTDNIINSSNMGGNGIALSSSNQNTFTNMVIENRFAQYVINDITGSSEINYLIYNNSFGQINWSLNLTTNISLNVGNTIFLENNTVGLIDDSQTLSLNGSARIEIKGLSYSKTPQLLKDLVRCDDTDNCNITSYNGGILYADVSSFSNYSTQETPNTPPNITSLILNTTDPTTNNTDENLTVYDITFDAENNSVKVIYNWFKDGNSITVLNMPFEANGGNELSVTTDYSGYGNNGTVYGGVTWNASAGYDGKGAYEFDSSGDYITVPNINLNASNNDFSVFSWTKIGQHDLYKTIMHKKGSFSILFAPLSGGGVSCRIINTTGQYNIVNTNTGVWTDTNWHFVGCEFKSNNTIEIYVDGFLVKSGTFAGTHNVTNNNITISDTDSSFFNGTIDEVMIFNHSLSLEQILALYHNRTDLIISQETTKGEIWNVSATPNDGSQDGTTLTSNSVTILNAKPTQSTPILNSTDPATNDTNQNLTAYNQSTVDIDGDAVKNIYNWK
ncbi:MAG: right-handed parallel beta-helix repeat-containing protein, partial [Nanoarchaeota archaeon]|nr:right-handed parallel beta-helix repeat-containing protein [Nanoarchaeota archaeon]